VLGGGGLTLWHKGYLFKQYPAQRILFCRSKDVHLSNVAQGIFVKRIQQDHTNISGDIPLVSPLLSDSSLCAAAGLGWGGGGFITIFAEDERENFSSHRLYNRDSNF
jgi:hypothetical protein